jgi:site-specific DNA recombinase
VRREEDPLRLDTSAAQGCLFGRGALNRLLRNRIYRGEVVHKGLAYPGEHKSIVDEDLWEGVQAKLSGGVMRQRRARIESGALLSGLIFDSGGNRMTPTYTVRRRNRYRYEDETDTGITCAEVCAEPKRGKRCPPYRG